MDNQNTDVKAPAQTATEAQATPQADPVDAIYAQAWDQVTGDAQAGDPAPQDADDPQDATAPETPDATEKTAAPEGQPAGDVFQGLSSSHRDLLKRNHVDEQMVAGWGEEKLDKFVEVLAKREADTSSHVRDLERQVAELGAGRAETDGKEPEKGLKAKSDLASGAQQVADQMVEQYGEEIRPLADMTVKLARANAQLDEQVKQLSTQAGAGMAQAEMLIDLAAEQSLDRLVEHYPSLSKPAVRKVVRDRMLSDVKASPDKYKDIEGFGARMYAALRDAAAAEFSQVTESAAQASLEHKTQQRLSSQPKVGSARTRKSPTTVDEIYDQTFVEVTSKSKT